MADDLHTFVQRASEAADVFFDPDEQMLAYFRAEDRDGKITIYACPMSNAREERAFRIGLPQKLRRDGYVRWCFFTEAWMAEYEAEQSPAANLPSQRPDRMEVVTFFAEVAATGETLSAHRQIYRDGDRPAKLLPLAFARERAAFVIGEPARVVGQ